MFCVAYLDHKGYGRFVLTPSSQAPVRFPLLFHLSVASSGQFTLYATLV